MKEFIINGAKFHSKKGFYNYVESNFTSGLNWKTGQNLNAFDDILEGGFGQHDYEEYIKVIWFNLEKSKERLGEKFVSIAIKIFEEKENVDFKKFDFQIR